MVAALGLGCPRAPAGGAVDAHVPHTTARPTPEVASRLAQAVEETAGGHPVMPTRVWVAQVKATPDQAEAERLATALQKVGVGEATVHRADLGAKGIWWRVGLGAEARKDLLEARAPAMLEHAAVKAALGPPTDGAAAYVPLEVPRFVATPGPLLTAMQRALGGIKDAPAAWVTGHGANVAGALVNNGAVVLLGADGAEKHTIPAPVATCEGCPEPAGATLAVAFAGDVAGDVAPELVVTLSKDDARAAVWMMLQGKTYAPVASVLVEGGQENRRTVVDWSFRALDTDADLEWLTTGAALTFFEGQSVCNATPVGMAFDVVPTGPARPMDARLHAANGVARQHGGAEEIRAFLKGVGDRAPDQTLAAALAYLAEAPDDAEVYRDVVALSELAGKEGRKGTQLKALAGLVAARHEWRVGLAPRLHAVLTAARTFLAELEGCDTAPLMSGAAARKARTEPKDALWSAARRPDARVLSAGELAALMTAFEKGSPLSEDIAVLLELLEARAPALVSQARAAVATRRVGNTTTAVVTAGRGMDGGVARAPLPLPKAPDREEEP